MQKSLRILITVVISFLTLPLLLAYVPSITASNNFPGETSKSENNEDYMVPIGGSISKITTFRHFTLNESDYVFVKLVGNPNDPKYPYMNESSGWAIDIYLKNSSGYHLVAESLNNNTPTESIFIKSRERAEMKAIIHFPEEWNSSKTVMPRFIITKKTPEADRVGSGGMFQSSFTHTVRINFMDPLTFTWHADGRNTSFFAHVNSLIYPESYLWDFGDGSTSFEKNPVYEYRKNDVYTVTLKVLDKDDIEYVEIVEIEVNGASVMEIAFSKIPSWWPSLLIIPGVYLILLFINLKNRINFKIYKMKNGYEILLHPNLKGKQIESGQWDFGDGTKSRYPKPRHEFKEVGKYRITLNLKLKNNKNRLSISKNIRITTGKNSWRRVKAIPLICPSCGYSTVISTPQTEEKISCSICGHTGDIER